ncbi:MAG TPA: hypothetical protein VME19_04315 [Streptosporangiaceae bacterium]|nr:hypothetical protein [Streptosporangiaceae bacterium]
MGEENRALTSASRDRQLNPSWSQVAATTARLWFERHGLGKKAEQQSARGRRLVFALGAVAAMALGALVTLAFSQPAQRSATPQPSFAAHSTPTQLQVAAINRGQAAAWIAKQISPAAIIGCDPTMCNALLAAGVPAARLYQFQPTTTDPLNATVVVATLAVRNLFGPRLASVYAPLLQASFGTGAERVDVRIVEADGTAAFDATLKSDLAARIAAGEQLLTNKNLRASPQARTALLDGMVDPRLLVTVSALAAKVPVQLILFDDSSPGASPEVPLRGAEIGASTAAGLSAVMGFLAAQRSDFLPSDFRRVTISGGQSAIAVQFDAPGPLGLNGT